jgi:Tfp pilus assembly PilM family ATPase
MRLLALEWDDQELRAVAARASGGKLTLERVWAEPLVGGEAAVKDKLAEVVKQLGTSRVETLVAVGRANLELRVLTIPFAPPDEVPDLVRFQAMRQFSTLGEDWSVDFVPLADRGDEGTTVLAAALSPDSIASLRGPCEAAGLTVKCLGLRPFAATAVLRELEGPDFRCRMLVDILTAEADLTVIAGGLAVLPRTVRLPQDEDEDTKRQVVKGEIRRTMIAASNQLGGRRVDELVIFGDKDELTTYAATLSTDLGIPVIVIDPFQNIEADADSAQSWPSRPGRFAPLLGLLLDHAANCPPQIDFLNPHRRPEPKSNRRLYGLIGAAAAAVLMLPLLGIWWIRSGKATEIADLQQQLQKLEKEIKSYDDEVAAVAELEHFEAGNIRWIDEMAWLSERLPPADKIIVGDFAAVVAPKGEAGGRVTLQAVADKATTVTGMEPSLKDDRHLVSGSGAKEDLNLPVLHWRFLKTIFVAPPDLSEPPREIEAAKTPGSEVAKGESP